MYVLVVGHGEVGKSMEQVIKKKRPDWAVGWIDKDKRNLPQRSEPRVMHVCFRYANGDFVETVIKYIREFNPKLTIINSTVAVGTCEKIRKRQGNMVVHVPVIGVHPYLAESIMKFKIMIGDSGGLSGEEAKEYYSWLGLRAEIFGRARDTELSKLLSTTTYGVYIEWARQMEEICDTYGVSFEKIMDFTKQYNLGYQLLGMGKFTRPLIVPPVGKVGGHCVLPNADILYEDIKCSLFLKELVEKNEESSKE